MPLIASAKDDCAPKPFGTFHVFHLSVTKGAVPGFSLTIGDLAPIQMKLAADSPIDILANFPRGVKSISWPAISDSDGPDVEIDGQRERLGRGKLELSQDQRTAIINTEAEFGKTATTTPIVPPRIEVSLGFRPFQTGADPVFFRIGIDGTKRETQIILYPPQTASEINKFVLDLPVLTGSQCNVVHAGSKVTFTGSSNNETSAVLLISETTYIDTNGAITLSARPEKGDAAPALLAVDQNASRVSLIFSKYSDTADTPPPATTSKQPDQEPPAKLPKPTDQPPNQATATPELTRKAAFAAGFSGGGLAGILVTAICYFLYIRFAGRQTQPPAPAATTENLFEPPKAGNAQLGLDIRELRSRLGVLEERVTSLHDPMSNTARAGAAGPAQDTRMARASGESSGLQLPETRPAQARAEPVSSSIERYKLAYIQALSGRKAADQFIQITNAASLARTGAAPGGAALLAATPDDTVDAYLWGITLADNTCLVFPGFTAYNNIPALSASDGRLARELFAGVFDLVSGGSFLNRPALLARTQTGWVCKQLGELALAM